MTREDRIKILDENKVIISDFDIHSEKVALCQYVDNHMIKNLEGDLINFPYEKKEIYFEQMDSISAAIKHQRSTGVDFLVFASSRHYGGGVWKGAKAQEEDIFLCTDLFDSQTKIQKENYPLNGVLVMNCHIIRDGKFNKLDEPVPARAFFAAAPNLNKDMKKESGPDFYTRMCTLTDATFDHSKGSYLVIGAWGCGVFKNDPREVAELFKKLIPLFQDDYRGVVVAIPDEKVLNIFKEVLLS